MAYVNIVTSDRGWILEQLAEQLKSRLPYVRFGDGVDSDADIQYYVTYSCRPRRISPVEVAYFAHLEPEGEAYHNFFRQASEVDHCISHAELYAQMLREHGIAQVTTVSPGVDLERFSLKLRVGVVGRTYHTGRKGEHIVSQLADIPEIEWSFTGEGWPAPALKLSDAALPDFYRQLDYVLVPSFYEGGPMCVVEALACGTPVIAPPVGWVPEFPHVEYKVGDVADLRRVLLKLVEEKRARRAAVLDRTWDNWAEGHDHVFHALARERGWSLKAPGVSRTKPLPPRIGVFLHGSEAKSPGGPSVRVPRLAKELRDFGSDARVVRHPGTRLTDFDLVHAFNAWAPHSALDLIRHGKAAERSVVFSPIYLDLSLRALWDGELPKIFETAQNETELKRRLEQFSHAVDERRRAAGTPVEPEPGYHSAVRSMVSLSDHTILLSERERERLAAIGADVSRSTVVHNPVDASLFSDADPRLFEEEFGLRDFVLCVARQESRKNQLMLMQALEGTNIPLVLIGHAASPHYVGLMQKYRTANIHLIERLPPNSPLLASAYAASRVATLPSWAEGAPLAALEAAAAGASLVLSDESGESEYFGEIARYIDPASVDSIRAAILEAYETRRSPSEVEAQKASIAQRYNWDRHRQDTSAVYRSVYSSARTSAEPPALRAEDMVDIVFDVTTSANHKGRWTGIARVETALALSLKANPRVSSIRFVAWNDRARGFVEIPFEAIQSGRSGDILAHYDRLAAAPALTLPPGARYVVAGSGWMQNSRYAEALVTFKYQHGLQLVPIIHDLIPIRFPFWFDDGYASVFEHNLSILLGNADLIAAISENTKTDTESFATSVTDLFLPPVRTFREGDEISQISALGIDDLPPDIAALSDKRFVLAVGAIHQRKNHKLLYDVWVRLRERMGSACPILVIAGGVAWNGHDVARALQNDKRISGSVAILDNVSDEALEWLYTNCLFTVYPSLYEGWGLPVSESLRYGKPCIASDSSSVPEIAPDLVDLIDPLDPAKWLARVQYYAGSKSARALREQQIRDGYRPVSWQESAASLIDVMAVGVERPPERLYLPGRVVTLAHRADGARFKREGWGLTESWGCWSLRSSARLSFSFSEDLAEDLVFLAEVQAVCAPGRDLETRVLVNGTPVAHWTIGANGAAVRHALIPKALIAGQRAIDIVLENAAVTPIAHTATAKDTRSVGIGVGKLALTPAKTVSDFSQYLGVPGDEPKRVVLGQPYDVLKRETHRGHLCGRWDIHPAWGAFNREAPRLALAVQDAPGEALDVELAIRPVASPTDPLTLIALVNGQVTCSWNFSDDDVHNVQFRIPPGARAADPIIIDLIPSEKRAPCGAGLGEFGEAFGFGILALCVTATSRSLAPLTVACEVGRPLLFSSIMENGCAHLSEDWHDVEADGVWSARKAAVLPLAIAPHASSSLLLSAEVRALAPVLEAVDIEVLLNGRLLGTAAISGDNYSRLTFPIDAGIIGADDLAKLEFRLPALTSPHKLGIGEDERLLGCKLSRLVIAEVAYPKQAVPIRFGLTARGIADRPFLRGGWYEAEPVGRWSVAEEGRIAFVLEPEHAGIRLFLSARVYGASIEAPVAVDIIVNGIHTDSWLFHDDELVAAAEVLGFAAASAYAATAEVELRRRGMKSGGATEEGDCRALGVLVAGMVLVSAETEAGNVSELLARPGHLYLGAVTHLPSSAESVQQEVRDASFTQPVLIETRADAMPGEILGHGWYEPEADGTWSTADGAELVIPASEEGDAALVEISLRVFGTSICGPARITLALPRGERRDFYIGSDGYETLRVMLQREQFEDWTDCVLTISRSDPVSPSSIGESSDNRPLGVMLRSISIAYKKSSDLHQIGATEVAGLMMNMTTRIRKRIF